MNNLIRISISDDWIIDYDKERGMYRVSYFQDNHFVDEYWFDAYEDKEKKKFTMNIKRFEFASAWWCGHCPKCGIKISYNQDDDYRTNRKQYCWHCGQLIEFE